MVDKYKINNTLQYIAGEGQELYISSIGKESLHQKIRPLEEIERHAIKAAIQLCDGNVPKAAVFLDVAPSTIYRKLKQWEKTLAKAPLDD